MNALRFVVGNLASCRSRAWTGGLAPFRYLCVFLMLISATSVVAEQLPVAPVRMRLEAMSLRARSSGPVSLRIRLEYNEPQLLEGNLVLHVFDGARLHGIQLASLRYDNIVLQGADFSFNMLLPPLPDSANRNYEFEAWFETKDQRIPLSADGIIRSPPETYSIIANGTATRGAIVCSASGRTDPDMLTDNRRMLHEVLSPAALVSQQDRDYNYLVYFPAARSAVSLPTDPLALCSYDLVLLTDGALHQLETQQIQAITTWVEAGGSLLIAPTDAGLRGSHLTFLQQLFSRDASRLLIGDDGRLIVGDNETGPLGSYFGLGRCVLMPQSPDSAVLSVSTQQWVRGFLWKLRGVSLPQPGMDMPSAIDAFEQRRQKEVPDREYSYDPYGNEFYFNEAAEPVYTGRMISAGAFYGLAAQKGSLARYSEEALKPQDIQMVPTSVVASLLLAYVLAVGPLDYLILGLFRARKYTWIVFPIVTVGFTLAMVQTAHHYLASNDQGGTLTITDVGDAGRPLRETQLELHYLGARQDVTTEIQSGLVASMNAKPLQLQGRFPGRYSSDRRIEQWAPEMQRTFSFRSSNDVSVKIDWDDAELVTTAGGRHRLKESLIDQSGIECLRATVYHLQENFSVVGTRLVSNWEQELRVYGTRQSQPEPRMTQQQLVDHAAVSSHYGFMKYVAQVSPGGGADLEDVSLLDPANSDQWLLCVLLKTDEGYQLIRRLYCVPPR